MDFWLVKINSAIGLAKFRHLFSQQKRQDSSYLVFICFEEELKPIVGCPDSRPL